MEIRGGRQDSLAAVPASVHWVRGPLRRNVVRARRPRRSRGCARRRPRGAKGPPLLWATELYLTSVVPGPFPPSLRDKLGQASSLSPKWPSLIFFSFHYDFNRTALYPGPLWRASVAGIALSCVLESSVVVSPHPLYPVQYLFPCAPSPPPCFSRLGNKAHCFYPLYACASPRAALLLRLRVSAYARVWGEKGLAGWRCPRGAFCNGRTACIFFNLFRFFTILTPFIEALSRVPDRPVVWGTGNT